MQRSVLRFRIAAALTLLSLVLAVGCSQSPAPAATPQTPSQPATGAPKAAPAPAPAQPKADQPLYGGTFTTVLRDDPSIFNPVINPSIQVTSVTNHILSGLVYTDEQGNIVPDLAKSWEWSADGKVVTFKLEEKVTWHDGKAFKASDVKWFFDELVMKTPNRLQTSLKKVLDKIETPDDTTVRFTLKQADSTFIINNIAINDAQILPQHLFEGTKLETNPANTKPVGTGPFKLKEYRPGEYITLEANQQYFKGRPYLDQVVYRIIPEPNTFVQMLEARQVDGITDQAVLPASQVQRLKDTKGVTVERHPYWVTLRLMFNFSPDAIKLNPWVNDVKVRQAIAHAIDKDALVKFALFDAEPRADSPLSESLAWAYNKDLPKYAPDAKKAEELLDAAGYRRGADGTRFTAKLPFYGDKAVVDVIADMLGKVGIKVQLQSYERATYLDTFYRKPPGLTPEFAFTYFGGPTGPDPDVMKRHYHSELMPSKGTNFSSIVNKDLDAALDKGLTALTQEDRAKQYRIAQQIIMDNVYVIPLHSSVMMEIYRSDNFGGKLEWNQRSGKYTKLWSRQGRATP